MYAYVNYPNPHFTIHRDPDCAQVQMHGKPGQRVVRVRPDSLEQVLADFARGRYRFAAHPEANDLWLDISLDTAEQEEGLVHVIQALVGRRYTPLAGAAVYRHCG
jgi:hypothetical protein